MRQIVHSQIYQLSLEYIKLLKRLQIGLSQEGIAAPSARWFNWARVTGLGGDDAVFVCFLIVLYNFQQMDLLLKTM